MVCIKYSVHYYWTSSIVHFIAWDQSDKYVKFYVTLKNVQKLPPENIKCVFTTKSLELTVSNLDNKDYILKIKNLLNSIKPEESSWKSKTGILYKK